mmetsp:Transcript_81817/g.265029  ORF Transcript_81817/g.265029 Transcript_81817/m.265029 type:complete len:293 (-) Transcript_81817:946-1824(-)
MRSWASYTAVRRSRPRSSDCSSTLAGCTVANQVLLAFPPWEHWRSIYGRTTAESSATHVCSGAGSSYMSSLCTATRIWGATSGTAMDHMCWAKRCQHCPHMPIASSAKKASIRVTSCWITCTGGTTSALCAKEPGERASSTVTTATCRLITKRCTMYACTRTAAAAPTGWWCSRTRRSCECMRSLSIPRTTSSVAQSGRATGGCCPSRWALPRTATSRSSGGARARARPRPRPRRAPAATRGAAAATRASAPRAGVRRITSFALLGRGRSLRGRRERLGRRLCGSLGQERAR